MKLTHGLQLAYCTNIHRGETWPATLAALERHTLVVRDKICPREPFGIGLRLGLQAAAELGDPRTLLAFQRWLDKNGCYVFTINGFPAGAFHGARVKEQVYAPDWTTSERLAYTNQLFDLLAQLVPAGIAGSVSTLPGSFKAFHRTSEEKKQIRDHLWRSIEHLAAVGEKANRILHLGLEPEPLCLLENTRETIDFFAQLHDEHPGDPRLGEHLGVNYDCCHFAIEYEEPQAALTALHRAGIKISKLHLSSALKLRATPEARAALRPFADEIYLHQVVARVADGTLKFYSDLPEALNRPVSDEEWRVHFHVPLHAPAAPPFANTTDHLLGALDWLAADPRLCAHLEMETYTWEVLPPALKSRNVVEQLVAEYGWTLARLAERGFNRAP